MLVLRPPPLLFAAALSAASFACSRHPPPPGDGGPDDAASPQPSASLPPIEVSPRISVGTAKVQDPQSASPVTIPDVLTIRAPNLDVQSHGVGREPWTARFLVTNETTAPLTVKVSDFVYAADDAGLPPADRAQAMVAKSARAEDVPVPVEGGVVTFTAPPPRQIQLDVELSGDLRVHYHVSHRHQAAFSVDGVGVVARSFPQYFRYPHDWRPPATTP